MAVHEIKCQTDFFCSVVEGAKKFEIREADRNYQVGDTVYLHETLIGGEQTGRAVAARITYITAFKQIGGHVVFGFNMYAVRDKGKYIGDKQGV